MYRTPAPHWPVSNNVVLANYNRIFETCAFIDVCNFVCAIRASKVSDVNGKQLVFLVKRGTDHSIMWRGTVRIKCHKVRKNTEHVLLSLRIIKRLQGFLGSGHSKVDNRINNCLFIIMLKMLAKLWGQYDLDQTFVWTERNRFGTICD